MFRYGKTSQHAISAMSRLAEVYDGGKTLLSSADIANARGMPKPLVAKVLTILAQTGLVTGLPGPGGGYTLSREPGQITLHDVVDKFERDTDDIMCPFGSSWCGNREPCPLHNQLVEIDEMMNSFLNTTTFQSFADWTPPNPTPPGTSDQNQADQHPKPQ